MSGDAPRSAGPAGPTGSTNGRRRLRRRLGIAALAVLLSAWGLTDVRWRGSLDPHRPEEHRTDFTVYTEAGAAFFDGRPPYEVANIRGWRYLYPPLFAMLLAPLNALPTQDQVTIWFFFCLLVCWGCYRESVRILRALAHGQRVSGTLKVRFLTPSPARGAARYHGWFPRLGVLALAAGLFPTLDCLQRGQVGIVKLYLLLLGFRLIIQGRSARRWIVGGIVLSMPIVLKVAPALPVCFLLLMQLVAVLARRVGSRADRPRPTRREAIRPLIGTTLGLSLGLALFFFVVPASLVGWRANLRHLAAWGERTLTAGGGIGSRWSSGGNPRTVRNQSLSNAVYRLGNWSAYAFGAGPDDRLVESPDPPAMPMDAPAVGRVLLVVRLVLLLALVAAGLRLGAGGDVLGQAAGLGLAAVAMLVVSPISRGHYFMFLVPGVLLVPLWLDGRGLRRAALAMAIVPGALSLLHYALLHEAGRVGLLGLGTTGWLIAAVALVLADRRSPAAYPVP